MHELVEACECRDEGEECAFGEMEVGHEAIDVAEAEGGVDEDVCFGMVVCGGVELVGE